MTNGLPVGLPLLCRRPIKKINFFHYPRVSTGALPLTKKPVDSGYEIAEDIHDYVYSIARSPSQTCQPPKRANLETLQKSPEKPGDWDLKPGDFQNMCKMKIKMVDFLFQGILYLICATYCILLPHFLKSVSVSLSTRGASLS